MNLNFSTAAISGILLDIEGVSTPIDFVHQTLFSYARTHVKSFLEQNSDSAEVIADLEDLRREHEFDLQQCQDPPLLSTGSREAQLDSLITYINWLIDRNRKSRPLKSLQGKIWKQGYGDGTLKSQIFTDVAPALGHWRGAGLTIGIFSSGSVLAQRLLFEHTDAGDLTPLINHYFDTTTGPKTDPDSYRRIAATMDLPPAEVLFLSDLVRELNAANEARMQTALCIRPGNEPQDSADRYPIIHSFDEISV